VDAYEAGWRVDVENTTGSEVSPTDPDLAKTMTGAALQQAGVSLFHPAMAHQYSQGSVEHSPRVTALSDGQAVVEDCLLDRRTWYSYDAKVNTYPTEPRSSSIPRGDGPGGQRLEAFGWQSNERARQTLIVNWPNPAPRSTERRSPEVCFIDTPSVSAGADGVCSARVTTWAKAI
jgi:hypothetical protein